jgi:hypothetical protein
MKKPPTEAASMQQPLTELPDDLPEFSSVLFNGLPHLIQARRSRRLRLS